MASYPITYACGHSGEVNLGGTDRARRLAWMAKGKCHACERQDREALGPHMQVTLCAAIDRSPGRLTIALSDAYPIRDRLKADGYRWDPAPADLDGVIAAVLSVKPPDGVWRRDWPLTSAGAAGCLAEAQRLLDEGVVAQDRVLWMSGDRARFERGFDRALSAAARHRADAARARAETEAQQHAAARSMAAKAAYRVAPGKRSLSDGKSLPVWLAYLGRHDEVAVGALKAMGARWAPSLRAWAIPQRDAWQDDLVAITDAARQRALAAVAP